MGLRYTAVTISRVPGIQDLVFWRKGGKGNTWKNDIQGWQRLCQFWWGHLASYRLFATKQVLHVLTLSKQLDLHCHIFSSSCFLKAQKARTWSLQSGCGGGRGHSHFSRWRKCLGLVMAHGCADYWERDTRSSRASIQKLFKNIRHPSQQVELIFLPN